MATRFKLGVVGVVIVLVAMTSAVVYGQSAEKAPLSLDLSYEQKGERITLIATVKNPQGRPVGMKTVEFFIAPDFFGQRLVKIGQGRTNVVGSAKLLRPPSVGGSIEIRGRVEGDARFIGAEESLLLELPDAGPVGSAANLERPLEPVQRTVALASAGLAVGVGLILLVVLGRTIITIRRWGRGSPQPH